MTQFSGRLWLPGFEKDPVSRKGTGFFFGDYGGYRTRTIVGKNPIVIANFNFVKEKLGF